MKKAMTSFAILSGVLLGFLALTSLSASAGSYLNLSSAALQSSVTANPRPDADIEYFTEAKACKSQGDCNFGEECLNSECVVKDPTHHCSFNSDCQFPETCGNDHYCHR